MSQGCENTRSDDGQALFSAFKSASPGMRPINCPAWVEIKTIKLSKASNFVHSESKATFRESTS